MYTVIAFVIFFSADPFHILHGNHAIVCCINDCVCLYTFLQSCFGLFVKETGYNLVDILSIVPLEKTSFDYIW